MSIDYIYLTTLIKMNQFSKAKILFETYDIDEISDKFIGTPLITRQTFCISSSVI